MSSLVFMGGRLELHATPTPKIVLSCYATALEITPSTEDVDVGVMCAPTLQDQGRTTYSAVATLLWEPQLYTDMAGQAGKACTVYFVPQTAPSTPTTAVHFDSRIPLPPWGRFEIGQRVEVELPLAVLSDPVYSGVIP